jgi:galactofuranosylgalactofuranosylrhamnosyl-N-acetylglucosaminyl-diphospho-decaprenol beta-1,5/1,6-galactofuranosyltransferase
MIQESLNHQISHLVAMQYSTVEIRHQAILDVLEGPRALHAALPTKLAEVREFVQNFTDARLQKDPDSFPPIKREKPPKRGKADGIEIPSRLSQIVSAGIAPLRHLTAPRKMSREFPETELTAMDAKWYRLAKYDSAIVSMNDGTSAAMYQRDPDKYRELLKKTLAIHAQLRREWPRLAAQYRAELAEVTSPEAWDETFRPWTHGADD